MMRPGPRSPLLGVAVAVAVAIALGSCAGTEESPVAVYVGGAACAECHEEESSLWAGSHHDLATQEATAETVLGDFNDATFTIQGVTSTFYQRGGDFFVRTDGPDGSLVDYPVAYTFGVTPLQQYLVPFPGGRYQVLGIAWDSRAGDEGGQRWFHLYPEEQDPSGGGSSSDEMNPRSPLHWTRPSQNWNTVCAECHSTNLDKGYDPESLEYSTTWSDLDVSCEACHGPGSLHVALARAAALRRGPMGADRGFPAGMARQPRSWRTASGAVTASLSAPEVSTQVDACAPCHARRERISKEAEAPLHDSYLTSLLREDLYYPDGQIREEVYEYGSFLQSKMYAAGVVCSDCHEPHSLQLQAPANGLCVRCHAAEAFDTSDHHFHPDGSTGATCVECHMPETTYMVVDPRRDHSIRVPRPDLTEETGAPNACNRCHANRSVAWTTQAFESWYGPASERAPHYGQTIHRARMGDPDAKGALVELAVDVAAAPIVRATALSLLARYPASATTDALQAGVADPDALVRLGALQGINASPPQTAAALAPPLLSDPVRAVRLQAARTLVSRTSGIADPSAAATLADAWDEAERAEAVNADHSSAWVSLGSLHLAQGRVAEAERAYRQAMRTDSSDVVAYLNLADLQRATGRDDLAAGTLAQARTIDPDAGEVLHALGLLRVREGDAQSALELFSRAAALQPMNARFHYVHGVALASNGDIAGGVGVLADALVDHPFDGDLLAALATYSRDAGDLPAAVGYARRLVGVRPGDAGAAEFLRGLVAAVTR